MDCKVQNIVQRYLAGELDVELAARALSSEEEWGMFVTRDDVSPADHDRIEALLAHALWLTLRDSSPENVPDTPFGAAEFRQMTRGEFFDGPDEGLDENNRPDRTGAS